VPQDDATTPTIHPASQTVVITGAASPRGIGRATAHLLASEGWNIAIIDLDADSSAAVAAELADEFSVQAIGLGADLADSEAARAAVEEIVRRMPPITGLVNLAGVSSPVPYLELDLEEWHRVITIDLDAVHFVTQPVARIMAERGAGRIVSISSVSAQRGGGTFGKTPYSSAKAGILGFSRALARELGEFGVTVNAVAPGPIDTDIMGGRLSDERKADLVKDQVIKRVGTVSDVAHTISFLLSDGAGFITGQTLSVNGGLHML
jgi:2-hydroxycyclohexanecarboxyl-CoA dehydrogenase